MIDTITATTEKLIEIYEDKDSARKDEIAALGGQTASGINVFSAFYDRLKEIREYHRKHPVARVVDANDDFEALLKEEPQIEFSREEAFGRYLDLHELYHQYVNSKFGEPIEYSAYLDVFSKTDKIPRKMKTTRINLLLLLVMEIVSSETEPSMLSCSLEGREREWEPTCQSSIFLFWVNPLHCIVSTLFLPWLRSKKSLSFAILHTRTFFKVVDSSSELVCIHDSARPLMLQGDVKKDGFELPSRLGVSARFSLWFGAARFPHSLGLSASLTLSSHLCPFAPLFTSRSA